MDHKPVRESAFPFPALMPNIRLGYRILKRGFDILASLCGLILLSPVFLVTAIMIYLDDPGPVFFLQDRNGLNGKVFRIIKFRSMVLNAPEQRFELETQNELDGPTFKIKNDPRVTRVGRFLRRTSIDELPQLVNILLGQMSVVGPRPLPTYETARLSALQRQRLLVKPGLTCYWQVSGRSDTSFEEWMEYDFRYIREQGIWTDLKLLLLTFPAVISGRGGVLGKQTTAGCSTHNTEKNEKKQHAGYLLFKRTSDIVCSMLGLLLSVPILLAVAVAIKIETPKNKVIFRQPRIGLNGTEFFCYKLTSMVPDAEKLLEELPEEEKEEFAQNFKLRNDPRITKVGRFIRKTSIDELPQLWNVLTGQMSLVGPRPPLLVEREAYGTHLAKVMSVRPGITGYWQVHGRSDTDFDERIRMAEYYIDHQGIGMDIRILFDTVKAVLTGAGAL